MCTNGISRGHSMTLHVLYLINLKKIKLDGLSKVETRNPSRSNKYSFLKKTGADLSIQKSVVKM